jgi:hypothetical protein
MSLWRAVENAWRGWLAIIRGDGDWAQYFALTAPGLIAALAIFLLCAFISIIVSALNFGVPTFDGFLGIMLVQAMGLIALLFAAVTTRQAVPSQSPMMQMLVPGTFALSAYLIMGSLVSLLHGALVFVLWAALVYLFYRLGRMAAGWTHGVSAAFGCLTVVLLAALPMTLYMLMSIVAP